MLRAGGVVYLQFPKEMPDYKTPNANSKLDNEKSGYYFIKKIVHEILLATGTPSYRASCELVAGAIVEKK
jgi:hypothetical protein